MIKLKSLLKERTLHFVANCIDGWEDTIAENPTMLAQLVENSKEITEKQFKKLIGNSFFNAETFGGYYGYNKDVGVAWSYNDK